MNEESRRYDSSENGVANAAANTESLIAKAKSAPVQRTEADLRRMRAAQKLKENLQRRKQQQRSRRAGMADEAEGLPAANSTEEHE